MPLPNYAYFKGQIVPYADAKIGVMSHALNYGTGVFSGVRGYWNEEEEELFIFRPKDHFKRFLNSLKMMVMEHDFDEDKLIVQTKRSSSFGDWKEFLTSEDIDFFRVELKDSLTNLGYLDWDLSRKNELDSEKYSKYVERLVS